MSDKVLVMEVNDMVNDNPTRRWAERVWWTAPTTTRKGRARREAARRREMDRTREDLRAKGWPEELL